MSDKSSNRVGCIYFLRRGDLVFFATEPGGDSIRHVALYLGDDLIMQAPNASRSVVDGPLPHDVPP